MQQELADLKKRSADEMRHCDKKILALDERSKSIPLRREKPRRHLRLQGPRPSSPQKKKANTIPPLTP